MFEGSRSNHDQNNWIGAYIDSDNSANNECARDHISGGQSSPSEGYHEQPFNIHDATVDSLVYIKVFLCSNFLTFLTRLPLLS